MRNQQLDIKKDNILDLEKKTPNLYSILLENKNRRIKQNKITIEAYYKTNIENRILKRNNIGLSFLIIDENTLIENKIQSNLFKEYLEDKGFKCSTILEYEAKYICIEWQLNATLECDGVNILKKLHKEFGLYNIPIVKHIEEYLYTDILPLMIGEDDKESTTIKINLPNWLQSLPCKKILSYVFNKNGIYVFYDKEDLSSINLSWGENIYSSYINCTFSLEEYFDLKKNIYIKKTNLCKAFSEAERKWDRNIIGYKEYRALENIYEKKIEAIQAKYRTIREFYFKDFDLDNLYEYNCKSSRKTGQTNLSDVKTVIKNKASVFLEKYVKYKKFKDGLSFKASNSELRNFNTVDITDALTLLLALVGVFILLKYLFN